ncbi:flavocytochrome c [Solibacillus sp. FSL W7-1472]|uniref:FAD-dependent oxidoreductase n=1 Tax=Solibacillus sp. FSL W7-1472 TaxID=2921707 RepID=UPI0030D9700B
MSRDHLIIVGAGMAGLCAAVEASAAGAKVIVLEKQAELGGSSLLSGCFMAFAETDFQKKLGIEDTTESLMEDFLVVGQYKNKRTLIEAYGKHQLATYNWLVEQDVQFQTCQAVSGHSNPRGHTIIPSQAIGQLRANAEANGVIIKTNAPVVRLVKNNEQVVGVVYEENGEQIELTTDYGVLLTAGGFSQSEELLAQFAPQLANTVRLGGAGNKGDGIKLAASAGAWLEDFTYLKGTYGFHPTSTNDKKRQAHTFYKGGIIVNELGKRFVNESISYKLLGDAALQQPNCRTYQVWDQTIMDKGVANDALYDFDLLYREGLIESFDTIEQLAEKAGLPVDVLQQTISTYNSDVKKGQDTAFGRTSLTHKFGTPTAIETAPFYIMDTATAMLATYAGVQVDEHTHVLNPFGEPIEGLYAAGEMVGGFHGAGYMTGSSLGKAAIFGRIAARTAIQAKKQEVLK